MNEYTYIIFDHNGRRLGKIEFGAQQRSIRKRNKRSH